ncbi:hypothetical protein BT63DRAFT_60735 [Microthyrium microscopicum]|uniref:Fatty acid hydroxylase domain-containing protein n=1 Tax=Microthyrium microscopicum TaxID=703497 RepID=A0A6A6U009_9PEZI|nr:hypothetical protein BT63DRAFT_60735 [Microthyrium microscopicum]
MASNYTVLDLPPLPSYALKPQPPLLPWMSDALFALVLPIVAYWTISLIFHVIDTYDIFPQYRLHTPAEILKRNHATRWDVFRDVVLQQIVQTIFGYAVSYWDPEPIYGKEDYDIAIWAQRIRIAQRAIPWALGAIGVNAAQLSSKLGGQTSVLAGVLSGGKYPQLQELVTLNGESVLAPSFASWEISTAKIIYWALIPLVQFCVGAIIVDTWQYFLHRAMHMNQYLYTTLHSRHHRLYVPYAYGALYNHPIEGFLLDTVGTVFAYLVTGLSARQCIIFFTLATAKTVDDHCGYALPWDPLQHLSGNNAAYHDIHHQSWGIKTNFSQPFFTIWDSMLGTMWKGGDVKLRYEKARKSADEWWEQQQKHAAAIAEKPQEKNTLAGAQVPSLAAQSVDVPEMPSLRRSPRKATSGNQASLKGLKERMSGSLPNGVPRVESRR